MKENEKNKYSALEALKKAIKDGESCNSSQINTLFSEIEKQISIDEKERKGLNNLMLILFAFIISILSFAFYQYDENRIQAHRITSLERTDSIYNTFMQPYDGSISYRIDGDGKPISYRQLMAESDTMRNRISQLERRLYDCEFELKFLKDTYPIKIVRRGNRYHIEATQIDSALMLLNVYRDSIYFDKDNNYWIIK